MFHHDQVLAGSFAKKFPNARRLGLGDEDRGGDMRISSFNDGLVEKSY